MPARNEGPIRVLRIKKGDDLKAIYAKAKKAFTAADLQRVTELGETRPAEELLEEMKAIHREEMEKKKSRRGKKV